MGEKENQDTQLSLWEVFTQKKRGAPHQHAGNVHAADAEMALQNARDVYGRRSEAVNMWVVPSDQIRASNPADKESFYDPADDKIYRHPRFYNVPRTRKKRAKSSS